MKNLLNILALLVFPLGFAIGQTLGSSVPAGATTATVSTKVLKNTTAPSQTSGGADGVVYLTKANTSTGTAPAQSSNKAVAGCKPAPVITATDGAPAAASNTTAKGAGKENAAQASANNGKATVVAPVTIKGDNNITQP